jgi:hypothetical protein
VPTAENFDTSIALAGQRQGEDAAGVILRVIYKLGPVVIVAGAVAIVGCLAVWEDPWQAFRGFTSFFLPVMLGAYVLRRANERLRRLLAADNPALWLAVPFFTVLSVGSILMFNHDTSRWLLGLAFLGLLIAVLLIVRITSEPDRILDSRIHNGEINLVALDIIVATVTAAGVLVLVAG